MAAPLTTSSKRGSPDYITDDVNADNCLKTVNDESLAVRLEAAIDCDSVDDVRAALEQGAPVNFLYKVKPTYLFTYTMVVMCK